MKTEKKLLEATEHKLVKPTRIKQRSPFWDLFPVDEVKVNTIAEHMREHGYDQSQPIIIWDADAGKKGPHDLILIDGHTRLEAAFKARILEVPVVRVKFPNKEEALAYAIHNQRDRRNLTDADIIRCIEVVDSLKARGGDHTTQEAKASLGAIAQGKSSEETAKIVGTSARKVEKARAVLKKADPGTKQAVLNGEKSINQAYQETKPKEVAAVVEIYNQGPAAMPLKDQVPKTKAITDKSLLDLLVTVYDRISELKKQNWQGCPKDKVKERLQMLLRLVEE